MAMAAANGRTPTVLVLGKEDYPAFKAWTERELRLDIERDSYRGVQVRRNPSIYLSRVISDGEYPSHLFTPLAETAPGPLWPSTLARGASGQPLSRGHNTLKHGRRRWLKSQALGASSRESP